MNCGGLRSLSANIHTKCDQRSAYGSNPLLYENITVLLHKPHVDRLRKIANHRQVKQKSVKRLVEEWRGKRTILKGRKLTKMRSYHYYPNLKTCDRNTSVESIRQITESSWRPPIYVHFAALCIMQAQQQDFLLQKNTKDGLRKSHWARLHNKCQPDRPCT